MSFVPKTWTLLISFARRAERSDSFLWDEGVPGAKMHRMMSVQYGNSVVSQRIVYEWIERFINARTSVKHGEGNGRQSTSFTDADMERVYGMILQNRQVTVDEVAHQLQISRGSACESIHNRHAFHKVCA
jgi:transposase